MPVLEAVKLYRFYHSGDTEVAALRGVSLSLDEGEMVALVGPSGSGKSTLVQLLAGLDEPDGGHVEVAAQRMSRRSEQARAGLRARHIGIFMQSGNLVDHLTVAGNIRLQRALAGKSSRNGRGSTPSLTVSALWNAYPAQLSGGQAALAGLAVALAAEPKILLCDEPTAEVDAESEAQIMAQIAERRTRGIAILVATHSNALASAADRVLHLRDG